MANTSVLEITELKVLLTLNYLGEILRMQKQTSTPLKSFNYDKKLKYEKATPYSKSYDSWNKAKAKLTKDEFKKVVNIMHALNMVRSAISSLIVPSQNPYCLRVL